MWRRRSEWDDMMRMHEEMDRVFNRFWGIPDYADRRLLEQGENRGEVGQYRQAACDMCETDKEVITVIEMPGVDKKNIKINVTQDGIEVKAEQKDEVTKEEKGVHHFQRSYSGFYRHLPLPSNVDADKAIAEYKDGVLTIKVPKKQIEDSKRKQIEVK